MTNRQACFQGKIKEKKSRVQRANETEDQSCVYSSLHVPSLNFFNTVKISPQEGQTSTGSSDQLDFKTSLCFGEDRLGCVFRHAKLIWMAGRQVDFWDWCTSGTDIKGWHCPWNNSYSDICLVHTLQCTSDSKPNALDQTDLSWERKITRNPKGRVHIQHPI